MSEVGLQSSIGETQRTGHSKGGGVKDWLERMIRSDRMLWGIGVASFLEATIVPIPLETILLPLMQARRDRLWRIALSVLIGCLFGAAIGYGVGYFLFDAIGSQIVEVLGSREQFESVRQEMDTNGFGFVFSVGVTPIPFQLAMLAAGLTHFSFGLFLLASALSRALRYFGLAVLVYYFGDRAERIYRRHKIKVGVGLLLLVGVFWIL